MYAIVKVGGKQYRVEKGESLVVDRLSEKEGAKVELEPLLLRPDKGDAVFAGADLQKVKVEAVVKGHERGPKVHVLKFKPKHGHKRRSGHRSELTRLEIGEIKAPGSARQSAAKTKKAETEKAEPKKAEAKAQPKKTEAKAETDKAPAKKPAAKKTQAKKSPAKKPAAKKEDGDGS